MTLESRLAQLSENKRALLARMIGQRTQPAREPIAVVGMGCRFPGGANDPGSYWRLLRDGRDVVTEAPRDRWDLDQVYDPDPDAPGKICTRWGAFLQDIDQFDATLFGISQAEADSMDPQQRILLETSWEALEASGIPPLGLVGTRTGVFIGIFESAYAELRARQGDLSTITDSLVSGVAHCMAAGRLSFLLGLQGPSFAVDTSCSSALVATHLACQALASGECDVALAGGVNVMLSLDWLVSMCRTRAVAPDGRCKAFDASANGIVKGEGCGVVVLKRLSDAEAAGDRILALIRGSAVNHDGRSASFTAPNGKAQQAVMRQALSVAGVSPGDVGHLEAHGTGTVLGDPIEVEAAAAVLGEGRRAGDRAWLTSVKTNLGHLESASGMASLIKVVLSLQHEAIPRHLHFRTPNPHLSLERTPFAIPTQLQPWPRSDRPRLAGVSSFGAAGTNAHLVLEEAPATPAPQAERPRRPHHLFCLSAQTEEGVRQLALRYRAHLGRAAAEGSPVDLGDLAFTANAGRTHLRERLSLTAGSTAELDARLGAYLDGKSAPSLSRARPATDGRPKLVFLFPGQGCQYSGMGHKLYREEPVFRRTLDACARALEGLLERPLLDVMFGAPGVPPAMCHKPAYGQPLVYAFECALSDLWKSWGVVPDLVLGHSLGELSASYAAGILPLEDGARLVAERGRLIQSVPGETYAVSAGADRVAELLRGLDPGVGVAAINGESDVVLSGHGPALAEAVERLERAGVEVGKLNIPSAAHSPSMEPVLDALEAAASRVRFGQGTVPLISNLTGGEIRTLDAGYLRRHLREPVRFLDGLRAVLQRGADLLLEVGPHPVLAGLAAQVTPAESTLCLSSFRRGDDDWETLLGAAGALHARGVEIDFKAMDRPFQPRPVPAPTYPFQRQRYWLREVPATAPAAAPGGHPLLHRSIVTAHGEAFLEGDLSAGQGHPFLDHRLRGMPLLPATATFGLMLEAASASAGPGPWVLSSVQLDAAVPLGSGLKLQLSMAPESGGARHVELHACSSAEPAAAARWWKVASGELRRDETPEAERRRQGAGPESPNGAAMDAAACYRLLGEGGLDYGPSFRLLERVQISDRSATAEVRGGPAVPCWGFPPQVADACLQALAVLQHRLLSGSPDERQVYVPVGAERIFLAPSTSGALRCEVSFRTPTGGAEAVGDVRATDGSGRVVLEVAGLRVKRVGAAARRGPAVLLYGLRWTPRERTAAVAPEHVQGTWVLLAGPGGTADAVQGRLRTAGARCVLVARGPSGAGPGCLRLQPDRFEIGSPEGLGQVLRALADEGAPVRGVVHLWPADEPAGPGGAEPLVLDLISLVRGIDGAGLARPPRLYLVTRGAQPAGRGVGEDGVAQAALWGAANVLALEHPELWGGCVDLGPGEQGDQAAAAVEAALASTSEDLHASWRGERHALRLTRLGLDGRAPDLRPDGTYLVTGGLGALGLRVARWLVDRGARHLLLLGRSAPGPAAEAQLGALRAVGAEVQVVQADVSREDELAGALAAVARGPYPLRGVVHAAAALADAPILRQTAATVRAVLGPKLAGAWNLHRLTAGQRLDFFVLFSSASGVMGVPGQVGYAAANAALDALAHYRQAAGLPALSVDWGPWADDARGQQATQQSSRWGVSGLDPQEGLEALGALISRGPAQAVVLQADWAAFAEGFERGQAPLYAELATAGRPPKGEEASTGALRERLQKLPARERPGALQDELRRLIARALNLPELEAVPAERLLVEAGVDSLRAVQARNALGKYFGRAFPSKLLFDCPTIKALAQHLAEEDTGLRELFQQVPASVPPPSRGSHSEELLARLAQLSDEEAESLAASLATGIDR